MWVEQRRRYQRGLLDNRVRKERFNRKAERFTLATPKQIISAYAVESLQNRHNFAFLKNPPQPRGLIHRSALIPAAARFPIATRDCAID